MFICAWADKPAAALGEPSEPADELVARQVFVAARGAVRDATLRGVARAGASLHVAEPDVTESGVRWLQDAMVSDVPRAAESAPELVALEAVVAAALATAAPVVAVWSAAARDRLDAGLSTVPVASPGLAPAHVLSAEAAVRDRAAAN